MGLFDFLGTSMDDPRTQASLALAAGLMNSGHVGQGLIQGMLGYTNSMEQSRRQALNDKIRQANYDEILAGAREREARTKEHLDKIEQAKAQHQRDADFARAVIAQTSPLTAAEAMTLGGGPTNTAAALQGLPRKPNWQSVAASFPDKHYLDMLPQIAASKDLGLPKVARTEVVAGPNNEEMVLQLDEYGRVVGKPLPKSIAMKIMELGDRKVAYNDRALLPGQTFAVGQSPDSRANNDIARKNYDLSRERFEHEKSQGSKPQYHDGQWVYPPSATAPEGRVVVTPGLRPPALTEAQGNAVSFYMRAGNALENMKGLPTLSADDYYAAKLPAGVGNFYVSDAGQRAINAEKQFIAAMLRKESGAAISAGEYATYGDQFFPRPGDSAETLAQKEFNRQVAMQGLTAQAGQAGMSQVPKDRIYDPSAPARDYSGPPPRAVGQTREWDALIRAAGGY